MYAVLRALFNFAEDSELIPRSPCRRIRLPQPTPRTAEILDADGLARLADAVGTNGAMVYLGALGCDGARLPACGWTGWISSARPSPSTASGPGASIAR